MNKLSGKIKFLKVDITWGHKRVGFNAVESDIYLSYIHNFYFLFHIRYTPELKNK